MAPPLQPFLKPTANLDSLRPHDIDDGLYNFLSPNFVMAVSTETGLQLHTLPTEASGVSDDRAGYKPAGGDGAPSSSSGSGVGAGSALEDMDGDGSALAPVPRLLLHSGSMHQLFPQSNFSPDISYVLFCTLPLLFSHHTTVSRVYFVLIPSFNS